MTTHEHAHPTGFRQYFVTWCWLLAMTLLALAIGYINGIPGSIKTVLLVGITLAKIFLIGSIFMHLKAERVNLVMLTFSPLVLSIILFCFTFGEVPPDATHARENVSPTFVMPTGHHAETGAEGKAEGKAEEHK
jgi:caa(3)-type oxidase subunit IV